MMDKIIKGKAIIKKWRKDMGYPFFAAMPATITLADAPIKVPLPPKQAPRASDHQTGSILAPEIALISWSRGIMVATTGILSAIAAIIFLIDFLYNVQQGVRGNLD